jgi:hypothetical protein
MASNPPPPPPPPAPPPPPPRPAPPGIKPEQIDILVTNCSIFCPTPSLASMLINKFKLRRDVEAYHLAGMGCSIGVVAVGLVRDMLAVRWAGGGAGGVGGRTQQQGRPAGWLRDSTPAGGTNPRAATSLHRPISTPPPTPPGAPQQHRAVCAV